MRIIVCLDERDGMLFNKRRQSSDMTVCRQILEQAAGAGLRMNPYSAKLFSDLDPQIAGSDDFLEKAEDAWCFVENADITPYISQITAITIYRWNRRYPSDVKFPIHLFADRWKLTGSRDFPGNSHETITREDYVL